MATKELNPYHYRTNMNYDLDLTDTDHSQPQASVRERADMRKRLRETLRDDELNTYQKKTKNKHHQH